MFVSVLKISATCCWFVCCSLLISACAPLVLVGGAATAVAVNDNRGHSSLIEDKDIEYSVSEKLQSDEQLLHETHINITSYNQILLLTGQAPTEELKQRAEALAKQEEKIKKIYNEIAVRDTLPFKARNFDFWLSTKIKSKLLGTNDVDGFNVKVVSSDTTVYLMGLVSRENARKITQVVAEVQGVTRIVKAFEYID